MGDSNRKRSRDEYEKDSAPGSPSMTGDVGFQTVSRNDNNGEEWTEVKPSKKSRHRAGKPSRDTKRAKREGKATAGSHLQDERKKDKDTKAKGKGDNKPALNIAAFHKIHSSLKISDLQALALYCLADGTSPQWIAVRHHLQIRKVVVLMVPGLERGMFSGDIELRGEHDDGKLDNDVDPVGVNVEKDTKNGLQKNEADKEKLNGDESKKSNLPTTSSSSTRNPILRNPDNFLPIELIEKDLSSPLKPLASIFQYLWPVKCPGDEKYNKVHSPLHAMLNSPLTRSKEESAVRGTKTPVASKNWENKRTPITSFITSADDLRESNYILHSLLFETDAEKEMEASRRREAGNSPEDGWVESYVKSFAEAEVPDEEIQSGSMTQGRMVIAVDCEMVVASDDSYALARISVVSWDGSVIMDELVKPDLPIKDYVTP